MIIQIKISACCLWETTQTTSSIIPSCSIQRAKIPNLLNTCRVSIDFLLFINLSYDEDITKNMYIGFFIEMVEQLPNRHVHLTPIVL